jgi:hypothetical protein
MLFVDLHLILLALYDTAAIKAFYRQRESKVKIRVAAWI